MTSLRCGRTAVIRKYMISKHAFTSHIVVICICSTTRTYLDPRTRVSISAWEYCETSSSGGIRLEDVFTTLDVQTSRTVSVS